MKNQLSMIAASALIGLSTSLAGAQVASHAPTAVASPASEQTSPLQVSDKPVVRVNGAVLTDRDLLREMFAIFPYAQQHNGFPKAQEPAIRQGALEMIIFEELVYQEAQRRKLTIPEAKLNQAEADFRQQFSSPDQYQQYLKSEMHDSEKQLRQQIRRSLLIERVLKTDVEDRSTVSPAEVRAYYANNAARFEQAEMFVFQSISVIPPPKSGANQARDAKKRADEALRQARATKTYQDFGLLAEKISEDDYRVNMGDHKATSLEKLPPQVVSALREMQPGQISGLIQIENAYTIIRLNAHTPARTKPFAEVKHDLTTELQKRKYEKLRSSLGKQLRAKATIEIV
jgi:peptidyl-prolyl cis-trans isomerase SurA